MTAAFVAAMPGRDWPLCRPVDPAEVKTAWHQAPRDEVLERIHRYL